MINSSPNAILAEGTDWRFLSELKHELKASRVAGEYRLVG